MVQHINIAKHKECLNKTCSNACYTTYKDGIQKRLVDCLDSKIIASFLLTCMKHFLAANIPLWKVSKPVLRAFLANMPININQMHCMNKVYVGHCYNNYTVLKNTREDGNPFCVAVTT